MTLYTFYNLYIINTNYIYTGSTKSLKTRLRNHKFYSSIDHPAKVYTTIKANGGWDNIRVEIIDKLEYEFRKDSLIKEQYYINFYKSNLNTKRSYATESDKKNDMKII